MVTNILTKLPPELCGLVNEIETAGHTEIEIRFDPQLQTTARADVAYGDCARGRTPDSTDLILWFKGDLAGTDAMYRQPFAVVCHELLHLHRWIAQGVPAIHSVAGLPLSGDSLTGNPIKRLFTTAGVEEQVEHCFIERALPSYGFDIPIASTRDCWNTIPPRPWQNWATMRWVILQEWLRVQFLGAEDDTREHAEHAMRSTGMLVEGRWLTDQFRWLLDSPDLVNAKYALTLVLCKAFRIPPQAVWFLDRKAGYLGVKNAPQSFAVPCGDGNVPFSWTPANYGNIPIGLLHALVTGSEKAYR